MMVCGATHNDLEEKMKIPSLGIGLSEVPDPELDQISASSSHTPFPPHGPPVVNPGGPILISCTVGVGCTTMPFHPVTR